MGDSLPAMVDLGMGPDGALTLSWPAAPGAHDRPVSQEEVGRLHRLAEAVGDAERTGRGVSVARAALGEALFDLVDGPERALGRRLEEALAGGKRLDLVVRALGDRRALGGHPATWMRWELLPFAARAREMGAGLTVVLQLGPQDPAPARELGRGGLRIQFMAFSPYDAPPELDFEREEEALLTSLAPLVEHRRARLRVVEEGTLDDLLATLLVERADVVHLSGHGVITADGPRLAVEDTFGAKHLVSPEDLLVVLRRAAEMPALVVLSACHSAEARDAVPSFAAELVAAGVPAVLGWTRPVRDDLATLAAAALYEQLGAGKPLVEAADMARDRLRRADEGSASPSHAWGTLALVSASAAGFRVSHEAEPLSEQVGRGEVYKYLGRKMRVLQTGFVGRRRLVQRLLRVMLHGEDRRWDGTRQVAGACVFGMKGVGKSCAVGRAIERARQVDSEMPVVVIHGAINERVVLEAFQAAVAEGGGDEVAERMLGRADEKVIQRVGRVMGHWRRRHAVVVLDDFEQNLELRTDGLARLAAGAAELLEALLPVCSMGKPKLVVTSTAEMALPGEHEGALASVPLGPFDDAAVRKLWMRGQEARDLSSVSLGAWKDLAARLGGNARVLSWARSLLGRKNNEELAMVARRARAELPVWGEGDDASEEKRDELAALFLKHMACEEARAAFGEDALRFVKRARVFEEAVPREAFERLAEGLAVDPARVLDALASWGLMEVGELDGAKAYRVSPLVEAKFEVEDAARWEEVASEVWEGLAERVDGGVWLARVQEAWEHALRAGVIERADRLARWIDNALWTAGLYAENLRLAERHLAALPESPFGHQWAGYAEYKALGPGPRAGERIVRGLALLVKVLGTEEHSSVASSFHELATVLHAHGDLPGARRALERSLDIKAKVLGTEEHASVAASLHELGSVLRAQGDLPAARRALESALAIEAKVLGTDEHRSVAASLHELGSVLEAQGDLPAARRALERSLAILVQVLGTEDHPDAAASLHELARVLAAEGRAEEAVVHYRKVLRIEEKCFGTLDQYHSAETEFSLAMHLFKLGQHDEASSLLQHVLRVLMEQAPGHPILAQFRALAQKQKG